MLFSIKINLVLDNPNDCINYLNIRKSKIYLTSHNNDSIVFIERHRVALEKTRDALKRSCESIDKWTEEITAFELLEAKKYMESILGRNIDRDVLDEIFRNFCIGK